MHKMSEEDLIQFIDTTAAMALANKAFLICLVSGRPYSEETLYGLIGEMMAPDSPHFERLGLAAAAHIDQILKKAEGLAPPSTPVN